MRRRRAAFSLFVVGTIACSAAPTVPERVCKDFRPLRRESYTGASLGPKQLALTFDDGHGSRTVELSTYLNQQGIAAGFFINGMFVAGQPGTRQKLVDDGHILANHTQDHFDLTDTLRFPLSAAGDLALVKELQDTDDLISPFVPNDRTMFRAPYGSWDDRVEDALHASNMDKCVGHIYWDIGGIRSGAFAADWSCWQTEPTLTTKACGDLYLNEIHAVGRGIVLMHDSDGGNMGNHALNVDTGNTIDMVKYLIPILKSEGYTFVRVDDVPAINAAFKDGGHPPSPPHQDAGVDSSTPQQADASSPPQVEAGTKVLPSPDERTRIEHPKPLTPPDPCL